MKHIKRHQYYAQFLKKAYNSQLTVKDMIHLGTKLMKKASLHHHFFGDYSWQATACALTYHALGCEKADTAALTPTECEAIFALFEKRIEERIPVEYISQKAQYCGHEFYVNEHVLVPRSLMSNRFKEFLDSISWKNYRVLDLCTGSGCIGITLALLHPKIQVDLSDISDKALEVAALNIEKHGLKERVKCIQGDGFENIKAHYDLIISNPPYVSVKEYNKSPAEFKVEPKIALESGNDGLDMAHIILKQAKHHLNEEGLLIVEVGPPAAKRLKKQYPKVQFKWFKYKKPNGRTVFFSDPGVFSCTRKALEMIE